MQKNRILTLKAWLHFLRLPNQILLWICVLVFSGFPISKEIWLMGLSFSLMLFVANAWNDWLDVHADQRNRPGTNPFQYLINVRWIPWTLVGLMFISFLLGLSVFRTLTGLQLWGWYIWLGLMPSLWAYSKWWQHWWLWKNVSASFLTASGILSMGWMVQGERFSMSLFWLVWLANLWREMAKDLEDVKGDKMYKKGNITRFFKVWHCQGFFIGTFFMAFFGSCLILKTLTFSQALAFAFPLGLFIVLVFLRQWTWVSRILKIWMGIGLVVLTQF
jgi:4-hydroxybenzoate polyprenyltransferase